MKYRSPLVLVLILALPTAARAREYYYFNKAEVSEEQYVADRDECDKLAGGAGYGGPVNAYVAPNANLTTSQNAVAAGIAGLFVGLMRGRERRRVQNVVERTCMADKGYSRYRIEKKVISSIENLKSPELKIKRYFELATAREPIGNRIKE